MPISKPNRWWILALMAAVVLTSGCGATRRLQEGEVLLVRNKLHVKEKHLDKDELNAILKQKPNR
ncbi:MAG: hypothetical protein AAGB22_12895, partial [Bacteroidota bacterium]